MARPKQHWGPAFLGPEGQGFSERPWDRGTRCPFNGAIARQAPQPTRKAELQRRAGPPGQYQAPNPRPHAWVPTSSPDTGLTRKLHEKMALCCPTAGTLLSHCRHQGEGTCPRSLPGSQPSKPLFPSAPYSAQGWEDTEGQAPLLMSLHKQGKGSNPEFLIPTTGRATRNKESMAESMQGLSWNSAQRPVKAPKCAVGTASCLPTTGPTCKVCPPHPACLHVSSSTILWSLVPHPTGRPLVVG